MEHMMRSKYFLVTLIFVTIVAAILVLLAIDPLHSSIDTKLETASDSQAVLVERVEIPVDASELVSATTEPLVSQMPPLQDGPSLLERHCSKCHLVQSLQQIKKSRTEWERTLAQMEGMGVHLDDTEKVNLLNYLTTADKP
jgi:hypothetical protein